MYTYEEALQASLEYFDSDLPAKIFVDKYALRDSDNNILESNPDQMHRRLAKEFARIEAGKFKKPLTEEKIYNLFKNYSCIIPQGSPIYGIGNPYQTVSISNCFVLDEPEDSYGGIMMVDQQLVNISKRRGGVGISLNKLRPKGFRTHNASVSSTGILSWMTRYSNSIREVGQCIEENQRVLTHNGLKAIKNVSPNDEVWTKIGWVKVNKVLKNGIKKTFRLTTSSGYSIITSEDHIYQTFDYDGNLTETRLNNLKVNNNIVLCLGNVSHTCNYVKLEESDYKNVNFKADNCILPEILDEKLAYLLGYSYGDGSIENNEYGEYGIILACSNDYLDIKLKLDKYCIDTFNYKINYKDGDGDLERLSINNKTIIQWLKHNELLKQKAGNLIFPEKILQSPISVQLSFLSGYFDADGDCISTKGGYRFRSIDKTFLEHVQVILSSVGIASKLSVEDRSEKNWNNLWSLAVVGNVSQTRFRSLFHESIKVDLVDFIASKDYWLTPFKSQTFDIKYNNYSYCPDNSQYLSFKTVSRLASENQSVTKTLLQDKVKSIELVGERETYDLVLEKEHLFWCEGLYVHNSGRRGALMLTLNVHHPDIEDFITAKNDDVSVTGANISVHLTDEFLSAVERDEEYEQRFPLENPTFTRKVSAKKIWSMIVHNAWVRAEPGIQFIDMIRRESPPDCYPNYRTVTSNPCGEVQLSILDSCRLMAINLFSCVEDPFTKNACFNYRKLYDTAQLAQRLMDDLVDLELECIEKILNKLDNDPEPVDIKRNEIEMWLRIKEACVNGRRTGLGITALGDVLAALNIKYDSDEAITTTEKIYRVLKFGSYRSSVEMAKELGPFPVWDWQKEKDNPFIKRIKEEIIQWKSFSTNSIDVSEFHSGEILYDDIRKYGRRNIANLTTAPTGTISTQAGMFVGGKWYYGTTSGIESLFKKSFIRRKKGNPGDQHFRSDFVDKTGDHWMEFEVHHPGIQACMDINGVHAYVEAGDIVWTQKVKLQAAAQKHVDHSISVTCNVPENIKEEEVAKIYMEAWKSGCKGFTVYRENCRSGVLVDVSKSAKRPKELPCDVHHITVGGRSYFVLVGLKDGIVHEVFAGKNGFLSKGIREGKIIKYKKGYKAIFEDETELSPITSMCSDTEQIVTRMTSLAIRSGSSLEQIVDQCEKVPGDMNSFGRGLARVFKKYIKDGSTTKDLCPECGNNLVYQEGCKSCKNCNWSKCS